MTETEQEQREDQEIEPGPDVELEPDGDGPDQEPDEPEDEPEQEPEPREPSSVTVLEQRDKKLAAETRRHEKALRNIYGAAFEDLQPCPLCLTDGWVIPAPPGAFPEDQWLAVTMAAGQDAPIEYEVAPWSEQCPTCQGKGKLRMNSAVPDQATLPCRDCDGRGWREKIHTEAYSPPTLIMPPASNGTNTGYNLDGPQDKWGRPSGHPHFGIEPAYVS